MVLANVNWLGVLTSALSLASAAQLLITGMLSFGFAEFLTFTGCVYATGAGLVAGFVVLPNTIRIRSSQRFVLLFFSNVGDNCLYCVVHRTWTRLTDTRFATKNWP